MDDEVVVSREQEGTTLASFYSSPTEQPVLHMAVLGNVQKGLSKSKAFVQSLNW